MHVAVINVRLQIVDPRAQSSQSVPQGCSLSSTEGLIRVWLLFVFGIHFRVCLVVKDIRQEQDRGMFCEIHSFVASRCSRSTIIIACRPFARVGGGEVERAIDRLRSFGRS